MSDRASGEGAAASERLREAALHIRERAQLRLFWVMTAALLLPSLAYVAKELGGLRQGTAPVALLPASIGLALGLALAAWVYRTRRGHDGVTAITLVIGVAMSVAVLLQRGANAPALIYGFAAVAVLLLGNRLRLAMVVGVLFCAWVVAVTWAAATGRLVIDLPNPLGADNARLLALLVGCVLLGAAARIQQQQRREVDALLEQSLRMTEAERDRAQRLADHRAQLAAEIGHEIRTPMTGLVGAAQLLAQQSLLPGQRQLVSIQRQSAERLLQLVNVLLDQAKFESEQTQAESAPFALRTLVAEVADLFAPQAHHKNLEIGWTTEADVPLALLGDALRVRQILSNLISNAIKFTAAGSIRIHLSLGAPGHLHFEVSDSGRGVPSERAQAIFEPFVSDAVGDEGAHSTGLGLPICRKLARLMGGDVVLRSTSEAGSSFVLELPCVPAPPGMADDSWHEPPLGGRLWIVGASELMQRQLRFLLDELGVEPLFVDEAPAESVWADAGEQPKSVLIDVWRSHGRCVDALPGLLETARRRGRRMLIISAVAQDSAVGTVDPVWPLFRPLRRLALREALVWAFDSTAPAAAADPPRHEPLHERPRVLLVDDNVVNQLVGKAMLDALGAEVVVADGGQAAIDLAALQRFDLVLMDLQMPGIDGFEATRRIRRAEQAAGAARTPIIALTGQTLPALQAQCQDAGMDDVLTKPYTLEQLRERVQATARRG